MSSKNYDSLDAAYERRAIEDGLVNPEFAVFLENRSMPAAMQQPTRDTVSPRHPMTIAVDIKTIGKLLEDLRECTSAASRCFIQGIYETEPTTGKVNIEWLKEELADVTANIEVVKKRFKLELDAQRILRKIERLQEWHSLA